MRRGLALAAALLASGCATPRLYSEAEIGTLTRNCGYATGEIGQEAEQPKLLFVITGAKTTLAEQGCVNRWAKRRNLHVVHAEVVAEQ